MADELRLRQVPDDLKPQYRTSRRRGFGGPVHLRADFYNVLGEHCYLVLRGPSNKVAVQVNGVVCETVSSAREAKQTALFYAEQEFGLHFNRDEVIWANLIGDGEEPVALPILPKRQKKRHNGKRK